MHLFWVFLRKGKLSYSGYKNHHGSKITLNTISRIFSFNYKEGLPVRITRPQMTVLSA